ncbi:P-loop containing nucleoside triphosphate hydrolase protein, partial [Mycena epipterygia]
QDGQTLRGMLRDFYNDQSLDFLSPHQREAVQLAFARDRSFVAILPTGGGKSLIYRLPAAYELNLSSVIICPNAALLRDQMLSSKRQGLKCTSWVAKDAEFPTDVQLIFVAVETAACSAFFACLERTLERLSRIVLDEAHQVLTSSSYR